MSCSLGKDVSGTSCVWVKLNKVFELFYYCSNATVTIKLQKSYSKTEEKLQPRLQQHYCITTITIKQQKGYRNATVKLKKNYI
jgi:hypothetical protein